MSRQIVFAILLVPMAWVSQRGTEPPLFEPAPSSPIMVARDPGGIVLADMDRDGHLDIVTTHWRDRTVAIRFGEGRLSFRSAPGGPIGFGYAPADIAVGDVNNDGLLDLGVTNHDSYQVDVLLGQGDKAFAASPGSPVVASEGGKPHTHGFALVDLNKDGNLDMVTGNNEDNNLAVLLGDGHGRFSRAEGSPFPVGPSPYPFGVGDIDGDGTLDIVTPSSGTGPGVGPGRIVTVLRGDGRGRLTEAPWSPVPIAANPYFVALGAVSLSASRRRQS